MAGRDSERSGEPGQAALAEKRRGIATRRQYQYRRPTRSDSDDGTWVRVRHARLDLLVNNAANVSSMGQTPIDFDDVMMERSYNPGDAYRRSKLAQVMFTIDFGAEATMQVAVSPELVGRTGLYYNGLNEARANAQAYDDDARRRLRELSLELTGVDVGS